MITPKFECQQNDDFVIVDIFIASHIKMNEIEYSILENVFRFYLKPYFLRLTFDKELSEQGSDYSQYDAQKECIRVYLPKKFKGQFFGNLNMLSLLLSNENALQKKKQATAPAKNYIWNQNENLEDNIAQAKQSEDPSWHFNEDGEVVKQRKPLIEVISSSDRITTENGDAEDAMHQEEEQEDKREAIQINWEQELPKEDKEIEDSILKTQQGNSYGFDSQYRGYFKQFPVDYILEIIDCEDPEHTANEERLLQKQLQEDQKFNPDHYIADAMQKEDFAHVFQFEPNYLHQPSTFSWSDKETKLLLQLPKKEYLISNEKQVFLGMLDILLAYCYNHRTVCGENTIESVWTICKLSSTLSWFVEFESLPQCLTHFVRRVLCFPLYRHFQLAQRCIRDAAQIIANGKQVLLRCFLELKDMLDHNTSNDQHRYLLSKLYLEDYCVWIQRISQESLQHFSAEISKIINSKSECMRLQNYQFPIELEEGEVEVLNLVQLEQMATDYSQGMEQDISHSQDSSTPLELL